MSARDTDSEFNAVRDLSHAPHAYTEEALKKGRQATSELKYELEVLEAKYNLLRQVADDAYELLRPWRPRPTNEGRHYITEYSCERLHRALVEAGYPADNSLDYDDTSNG